ncbi:MAG: DUF1003 domain-containing protein [Deinococcales bacterium]
MDHAPSPATATCPVCGRTLPRSELVPAALVRPGVREAVRRDHPGWRDADVICRDDLAQYRAEYVRTMLEADRGELDRMETQVVQAFRTEDLLSENVNETFDSERRTGQRIADAIADFGGSWTFIVGFLAVLALWIGVNASQLLRHPFDPYPFILLNLVLSCLAAIQAPVILMSQNRQEAKDRMRAEYDFRTNLKAELEVRLLHEKLDHLLQHAWGRLLEIQQLQLDLMAELDQERRPPPSSGRA